MKQKLILRPFKYAWMPVGAWLPLLLLSQFNWAYAHHDYRDLGLRLVLASICGLVWGGGYAAGAFSVFTQLAKTRHAAAVRKLFALAHLPVYLFWLQTPFVAWPVSPLVGRVALYLAIIWGLGCVGGLVAYLDFSKCNALRRQVVAYCEPARCFEILEGCVLLLLPGFILFSLKKYLPAWFWVIAAVILIGGLCGRKLRRFSAWTWFNYAIAVLTGSAVGVALWNIYQIGSLYWYGDTSVFIALSKVSLWSSQFWWWSPRPVLTPLIFKLFQSDLAAINVFYIVIYLAGAALLILALMPFLRTLPEKLFLCYVLLLLFLNQHDMSLWLSCALTEVPSIFATVGVVATFAICARYREMLRQRPRLMVLAIGLILLTSLLFTAARDTNVYFLPGLALFYGGVLPRWRDKLIVAVCLLALLTAAKISMTNAQERWGFPLGEVVRLTILPDENLRRHFQQFYHFPADAEVMSCANVYLQMPCPAKETLRTWVRSYGLTAYQDFLLKHPGYVFKKWLNAWDEYQQNMWILEDEPKHYADAKVRSKTLNPFIFNFPGAISFQMALLLCICGVIFLRQQPVILFCLAYAFIVGIVAFHGTPVEVARHYQQATMTLKIAFLLCGLHIYPLIKEQVNSTTLNSRK